MIFLILEEIPLWQMIRNYLGTTVSYWWVMVPGVLMPVRDFFKIFKRLRPTPRWVELTVAFLCLSVAQFLAYRNTERNLENVIEEKCQFHITINSQAAKLKQLDSQLIASKSDRPITIENKLDPSVFAAAMIAIETRQKQSSQQSPLRNRVLILSKNILNFALERSRLEPSMKVGRQTDEELQKSWEDQARLSRESESQYALKFGPELAAVFQGLKANGVTIDDNWDWRCGSVYAGSTPMMMQQCAAQLGVFADQLP